MEQLRFGDVRDGYDVEKAYRFYEEYAALTADECKKCWAILQCREMCFREYMDESGLSRERKLKRCDTVRARLSDNLSVMCAILEENQKAFDFLNSYHVS